MRNIPFAFLDEETIDQINRAAQEHTDRVDAFAHLAATQRSMRGVLVWADDATPWRVVLAAFRGAGKRLVAMLEKMMEMSGPNSIANLERALRTQQRR